ncbi:nucleoside-diphosphate kinase [Gracilibacillus sp. HCP3S3_G5_1]|uniref:nucleoside-diphosphate kinase n=1 Tax=unclassified Gracilibacillus TaxID=2625209 RepID=UPI003F8CBA57
MEQTFIMIKPDAVQRNLIGEIIARFERKGFKLVAAKLMTISETLAKQHYAEHDGKSFFNDLVSFITSGPVFAMVWQGENVIATSRKMMGKTNPQEAETGTIRGDYGMVTHRNIIHGSDSPESAAREINLFFNKEEIQSYEKNVDKWLS